MFSISEFVKNVGSELNIRGSHSRMSLPEVQDTGNLTNEFQGYDQSHEDFARLYFRVVVIFEVISSQQSAIIRYYSGV